MKRSSKSSSDSNDTVNAKSSKRSREEEQTDPLYGSKQYWEARYKSHLPDANINISTKNPQHTGESNVDDSQYLVDGVELSKDAINPGHAWYFTYEELRPLILPLILGSEESEAEESESECDDSDSWVEEEEICEEEAEGDGDDNEEEDKAAEEHQEEDAEDCAENDEDVNSGIPIAKEITLPDKPKKVLEVGCGDVALGVDLASDLVKMQGVRAKLIVDEICCIDYSEIVVKTLIDKQSKEHNGSSSTLQASFHSLDARSLPHAPNTFDLVLEKGTLDAMLSDQDEGKNNCIQIVKEMARVTNIGGSIVIVSHLNANEAKGMSWLEDVVFSGLKAEFRERQEAINKQEAQFYTYRIGIHGGEGQLTNDEDGEEVIRYGPAVYILKKISMPPTNESSEAAAELTSLPPVKVEFLTYD